MSDAKKLNFDPTVNLGHVLTFLSFMAVGAAGYNTIDKRVTLLEEKAETALRLSAERVAEQKETLKEIKGDIKELSKGVNDIQRAVGTRK